MATRAKTVKTIKKLERDRTEMISAHRGLNDLHKQKRTARTKKKASEALHRADKLANRIDNLQLKLAKAGGRTNARGFRKKTRTRTTR
jgi:hypothetical protein